MEQLTLLEVQRLEVLESVIDAGMQTFVHVGNALLEIRDSRLYRQTHGTFDDYCRERWQMDRTYAHRTIEAAKVARNLLPIGNTPSTESQTRPLTALEPDAQREVWQRAVETAPNGKVTAAHVQAVVDEYRAGVTVTAVEVLPSWAVGGDDDADDTADELPAAFNVEDQWQHVETVVIAPSMKVHYSSETPEHYTPDVIIEATCAVMGGIDLDPCSNSHESPRVPAGQYYTAADDGLTQYWSGRVYMNPPYGREIGAWVAKLVESYTNGDVSEWVALVPGRVDTEWWQCLTAASVFVCFVDGRLTFVGNDAPAPFPSAVVYAGENFDKFYYTFAELGPIWKLVDPQLDFGA